MTASPRLPMAFAPLPPKAPTGFDNQPRLNRYEVS
jgi:hypothetical protein